MIVRIGAARGLDPQALQAATGFDEKLGADPDARIPLEQEEALWNEASRALSDEAFGLHAAELLRPGYFDVLDYAVRTAPNLRASLERLVRYNRLVHDAAVFRLNDQGDAVRIEHAFRTEGQAPCRHAAEFTLASIIVIGGQIAQTPVSPRKVEFIHPAPRAPEVLSEHRRVFGLEPTFSQKVNAMELDKATLERPNPSADPALSKVIERHAESLLAQRPELAPSTMDKVRRLLPSALKEGNASLKRMAIMMRMSERSLQRRLADEGTNFDEVLDGLRRDLALRYLADGTIGIAEVAYLLGYSEPSPFHRAFRRWTGRTPRELRGGD